MVPRRIHEAALMMAGVGVAVGVGCGVGHLTPEVPAQVACMAHAGLLLAA